MRLRKYIPLLILASCSFAQVKSVKEQGASLFLYPFKEVCTFFGVKDALMADKVNAKVIDCMGKKFEIEKFCLSKFSTDSKYTKARFDISNEKVGCSFAQVSTLEVTCSKKYNHYCSRPKEGCLKLKTDFAYNLSLVRSYLLESSPAILKCHYLEKSKSVKPLL